MRARRNKKSILPDLIFSKFFLIFVVILFLGILFGLAKGTVKNYRVNSEVEDLQNEINQLEKQNQDLGQLIGFLKSGTFIEQEAKLKMGLKKQGEKLVVIPKEELGEEVETEDVNEDIANPAKWWAYFFD